MIRIPRFVLLPRRLLTAPRIGLVERQDRQTVIEVQGLVCSVCAARTKSALQSVPGVHAVEVDLASGRATLQHDGQIDRRMLAAALERVVVLPRVRRLIERVTRGIRAASTKRVA